MATPLPPSFSLTPFSRAALVLAGGVFLSLAPGVVQTARAEAGLSLSRSGVISDRLEIQQQRVVSGGVRSVLVPLTTTGRFISDTTPPAPGQRVTLFNITPGFSSEPFTERDYSSAGGSEAIVLSPGGGHETRQFSVLPGNSVAPKQNDFRYEIANARGEIVETGDFSVSVGLSDVPVRTVVSDRGFRGHGHSNFHSGLKSKFFRNRRFHNRRFRRHGGSRRHRSFRHQGFRH